MSVRSPRTPADWQAAQLPPELYARYGGSLELAPTNLFPSQYLLEVTGDNDPVGWLRPRPAREDGYSVYVTQAGAKQKTLTAQNSWPIPPEQDAWVGNQPIVNGMLPVRDLEFAANVVRLLAPRVSIEDAAAKGFTGGDYWCGEAYRDRRGRRTTPTGFVKVTVANGNSLKFPAATNVPEDAAYREILVSRVGKGAETARVQRVIKLDAEGRGEVNVSGPWRAGKLAAQTNQTKAGRAAKVSLGHQVRRVKAAFNLQARAFRFACQLVTGKGSSLVSEPTNEVVVQGDPELDENGNPTGNTLGYTAHEAFRFRPRSLPRGYRFVPWVQMDGVWYYAIDTRSPYPQIGFGRGWLDSRYHVPIYGYTQENAPPGCRIVLVQAEPPFEDTTGIEAPDPAEAIDAPTTYGSQVPVAGDYLSAVALSQNGRPGRVSPPSARFTLNGSQIFRVIPPKRVNILPNAELSERDAANNPRSWTINAAMAGGAYAIDDPEPGVLRLSTNGPISGTTSGDSPNAITSVAGFKSS